MRSKNMLSNPCPSHSITILLIPRQFSFLRFPFVTELVDKKRWGRKPPKELIVSEVTLARFWEVNESKIGKRANCFWGKELLPDFMRLMKVKSEHCRHQVHRFGPDILQVEAFLDFSIGSAEAAYNILIKKVRQMRGAQTPRQRKARQLPRKYDGW